jgi:hypothetical protein
MENANGRSQIAQIVLPRSRVKDELTELHGGSSGGHLGDNKTLNNVRQRYNSRQETILRDGDKTATPVQHSRFAD